MVVVFLDGVDGAGKTTLLHRLVERFQDQRIVVAPPLWQHLPAIINPDDFADWVTTTEPARVAVDLLTGQHARIAVIQQTMRDVNEPAVLVDRGPRTIEASARAHLGTVPVPDTIDADVERHVTRLRDAVRQLAEACGCLSIALTARSYDEIVDRLTDDEKRNHAYLRYLHRFLDQFRTTRNIDGVSTLALAATDALDRNCSSAERAIATLHLSDAP